MEDNRALNPHIARKKESSVIGRRNFLKRAFKAVGVGVLASAGFDVLKNGEQKLNERFTSDLVGKYVEGYEGVWKAKVTSIDDPNNLGEKLKPIVRENYNIGSKEINEAEFDKYEINLLGDVEGELVYGGAYNGIYGGYAFDAKKDEDGRPMGEWFKIKGKDENGNSKNFYIARSFVSPYKKVLTTE